MTELTLLKTRKDTRGTAYHFDTMTEVALPGFSLEKAIIKNQWGI